MKAHENPFRVEQILKVRYRPQAQSWQQILVRFDSLQRRACLLGEEGSGKTTFLEDLLPHLECRGYRPLLQLHSGQPPRPDWHHLASLGPRDVLLLDGADLLSLSQWWRVRWLSRRWGGLLAVSHQRALLPVLLTCQTSPKVLQEILLELLPQQPVQAMHQLSAELFAKHRGNLREALRDCYDRWAAL